MNGLPSAASGTGSRICLIGLGNTLRSDDGAGHYVCRRMQELTGDPPDTFFFQQLSIDLLEDFLSYDCIIVADAAVEGPPFALYPAEASSAPIASGVHQGDAGLLNILARKLYNKQLPIYLCQVRGFNFDFGESLSDDTRAAAEEAVSQLLQFITQFPLSIAPPGSAKPPDNP